MKCISIRLPDNLHKKLKVGCAKKGVCINPFVIDVLSKAILSDSANILGGKKISLAGEPSTKESTKVYQNIVTGGKKICPYCDKDLSNMDGYERHNHINNCKNQKNKSLANSR